MRDDVYLNEIFNKLDVIENLLNTVLQQRLVDQRPKKEEAAESPSSVFFPKQGRGRPRLNS